MLDQSAAGAGVGYICVAGTPMLPPQLGSAMYDDEQQLGSAI